MTHVDDVVRRACFSVVVDNEPGVLARVIGLFAGRGYNIESLTVCTIDHEQSLSRITIISYGVKMVIDQIKAQLEKLVPVHCVTNITEAGASVEKEVALVRFTATGDARSEGLRIADIFKANVADTTHGSFIFALSGSSEKVDAFIDLMSDIGVVEIARSGVISLNRTKATTKESLDSNQK